MDKQILQVEFRYQSKPKSGYDSTYNSKTITIGIYDTLDDAVKEGNKIIDRLNEKLTDKNQIKDKLSSKGYIPNTIATNYCNSKVSVFVTIHKLHYDDLDATFAEAFKSQKEYDKWNSQYVIIKQ